MDGKETELEGMDWIHLAEDRGQCGGCCEYGDEPSGSRKRWGISLLTEELLPSQRGP